MEHGSQRMKNQLKGAEVRLHDLFIKIGTPFVFSERRLHE